jgi:hypothetical protein
MYQTAYQTVDTKWWAQISVTNAYDSVGKTRIIQTEK